jgi:hypothetical protein
MARVTTVPKCRKPQTCGKCGEVIPVGDGYRHATPGFRGRRKVRCMKPGCMFRQSDLTTSNMSGAYAAIEGLEDEIPLVESLDDMTAAMATAAEGLREVAEMYDEASQAWGDNGHEEWDEKRDTLNDAADELENFQWEPEDGDTVSDEDDTLTEQGIDALRAAAEEHVGGVDVG